MGSYYSNSWMTLIAGLNDHSDGLFGSRYLPEYGPGYYRLPLKAGNEKTLNFYFTGLNDRLRASKVAKSRKGPDDPLVRQRGWTLQEEVLSGQFLIFEPRQTYLCSADGVFHESGHFQGYRSQRYINMVSSLDFVWAGIVSDYTRRQLTYEMDKLPALSGLAHQRKSQTQDNYAAGLWKESILHDLAWWTGPDNHLGTPVVPSRPITYRAPSWSWASIDGPINYRSAWVDLELNPSKFAPVIVEVSTTTAGKDPLGQVKDGHIFLQTQYLFKFTLYRKGPLWTFQSRTPMAAWTNTLSSPLVVGFDVEPSLETEPNQLIWCLPLRESFCLMLARVEGGDGNVFKRVGAIRGGRIVDNNISNVGSIKRTLTIV